MHSKRIVVQVYRGIIIVALVFIMKTQCTYIMSLWPVIINIIIMLIYSKYLGDCFSVVVGVIWGWGGESEIRKKNSKLNSTRHGMAPRER